MPSELTTTRAPIQPLPELLVNQIAAGEVVERPASVIKEVLENAIDAGATRITVELEAGGIELMRITDDGIGIPEYELPLAIAPHATSKIRTAEDLDRIATMGFRGEALASIASVSRLSIKSRTKDQAGASEISVEGDRLSPVKPASGPHGTSVSVRNLFFNTPARRKFLRTPATEQGHCLDVVCSVALAHPHIGFLATCDGRRVLDLPPGQGPRARALAVLGPELEPQLIECSADQFDDARGITLWGLIGTPEIARATAKAQHLFLNGRTIRDKTVQHAVREAYRGLIEPGRYPTALLMIEMDPGAVDVNVHPAKAEVRFRDQSMVHGVILRAVRDALRRADLTPTVGALGGAGGTWSERNGNDALSSLQTESRLPTAGIGPSHAMSEPPIVQPQALAEFLKRPPMVPIRAPHLRESVSATPDNGPTAHESPSLVAAPRRDALIQVHKSFVVTQDEQGLLIVDQHALHERVMFEALLKRFAGSDQDSSGVPPLESQRLLVPTVIPTTRTIASRIDELRPLLGRIGMSCEALGPDSVGVSAFPTFLFDRGVDPGEFLSELFEKAEAENFEGWINGGEGGSAPEAALHEVLDMMACKAAVKAGDYLTEPELVDLLKLRDLVERSSNCPHGRPTSIRLTIKELEKRFGRT